MNSTVLRTAARPIAALLAALLVLAGVLAGTSAARAAEIPGAVTSVTTDKSSYGYSERLTLSFTWAVPDGSRPGDSFQLALPDELAAASLARFSLNAPDGTAVADAVWDGKTVVFTLTDYVASHDAVSGSGYLTVQWDHSTVTQTGGPVTLRFGTSVTTVTIAPKPEPTPCTTNCGPAPVRTERGLWKGGSWADGAYEGTRDPKDNINWTVEVPGDQTGIGGPVDVVDAVGAGSVIDCASIRITTRNSLAGGTPTSQLSPYRYTLDCSDTGFHLVIDTVGASEFIDIAYKGTITDQSAGTYGNEVTITAPGKSWTKTTTIKRTAAGGVGSGVQSVSVGDYVWLDADRDGLQGAGEKGIPGVVLRLTGPDGGPVTGVDGTPVAPATTDAEGHYLFAGLPVLGEGQHYTVSIDREASAAALGGLLPTVAGAGADRAKDSSTWSAVSAPLTANAASDLTLDFGFVAAIDPATPHGTDGDPAAPAAPVIPAAPAPTPTTVPAGSTETLAHTGSDITLPLAAGLALLVLGATGALAAALSSARRRRAG